MIAGSAFARHAERSAAPRGHAPPAVDVAVAIVRDEHGRVLVAERTARQAGAGYWELPGGKVDRGETAMQAAARELHEECGLAANALTPRVAYVHHFPTKTIRLHFFAVERWSGQPHGREGQRTAWVDPAAPAVGPLLPSNERIMFALGLPPLAFYARSADDLAAVQAYAARTRERVLLVCRAAQRSPDARVAFVRQACALLGASLTGCIVDGTILEARRAAADGIVTGAADLRLLQRPPLRCWLVTAANAAEARAAIAAGADALVTSDAVLRDLGASLTIPAYIRSQETDAGSSAKAVGAAGIAIDARLL